VDRAAAEWRNEKKKTNRISWTGPVLAGGRLLTVSSRGQLLSVAPETGQIGASVDAGEAFNLSPVVAGTHCSCSTILGG
jgi:hypothetical protein